jgi:hypothetical protein
MSTAPLAPLTHHQILDLVGPYTRSGRQLDLAASRRDERRLVFKSQTHALGPAAENAPGETTEVVDWLELEVYPSGSGRLTRTLVHPGGLRATVQASGPQTDELLARVEAVPPRQQFECGAGYTLARSYAAPAAAGGDAVLSGGEVQLDGLNLKLSVPALRGVSADLALQASPQALDLPQDLLAVLGWSWARLIATPQGWKSKLRLRGTPARRTARAEQALSRAASHLAQVLAEAPGRFHDRHRAARLGVVFRRAIPLLTPLVLVATILLMPRVDTGPNPGLWLVLYHVPTLLVVLSFCLQELPQLEIPPWPRRSTAPDWLPRPAPRRGRAGAGRQVSPGTTGDARPADR